jgi:hypothetical protein
LPASPLVGVTEASAVELWQIYFITSPHRWITLILVATDPDRREGREGWFLPLAVIFAMVVLGVSVGLNRVNCLVLADFTWNAWHFASQHGGILRIYGRMGGGGRPVWERWGFRVFITYVSLRTAGYLSGWTEAYPMARSVMHTVDLLVLIPPAILVLLELTDRPWQRRGKVLYLISVVSMYVMLLLTIRQGQHLRMIMMSVASSAFHSVEYLAIMTFYAWRRRETGSPHGLFRRMAQQWLTVLALYMLAVGLVMQVADLYFKSWVLGFNLWAAYLHYAYDGMIWKLRRPRTAQALNV